MTCPAGSVCKQYVRYQSKDKAGNWEDIKTSAETRIDKEKPTTSIKLSGVEGDNGWYVSDVTVTLSCDDGSGSGCSETYYCVDQSDSCTPSVKYTGPFLISNEDINYVRYHSKDNVGNVEDVKSTEVKIDKTPPTAWINPLPEWTNSSDGSGDVYFDVYWNGDDGPTGSGITSYSIQYIIYNRATGNYVTNNCGTADWCDWITRDETDPKQEIFGLLDNPENVEAFNNHTFLFRISAKDNAGNVMDYSINPPWENTSIDVVSPVSAISTVSYPGELIVEAFWQGWDNESGVAYYDVQSNMSGSWDYLTDTDGNSTYHTTKTSGNFSVSSDGIYYFRVRAVDRAGNVETPWKYSSVLVDVSPPVAWMEEPYNEWMKFYNFTVNWSGYDTGSPPSGIKCYDVQWSNDTINWNYIQYNEFGDLTECVLLTETIFGLYGFTDLKDGITYYFRVRATDNNGNIGNWSVKNTTIDTYSPVIIVNVTDDKGREIIEGYVPADVKNITITSMAWDNISGIKKHTIHYWLTQNNKYTYGEKECGEALPWGDWSNCSITFAYDEDTVIKYYVKAEDRAGNVNTTPIRFTTSHPLANFVIHQAAIGLGDSILLKVQVRNIQETVDNITISIESTITSAKPKFENIGSGDFEIQADGKVLQVYNLNPMEEREFFVRIYSSEIGTYYLNMTAQSNVAQPGLIDTDSAKIIIGYPPSFPGLAPWSILLLVILSVTIFLII
ncbi:hypothetical protein DRJ04_06900 [Candidatus Aerophobetes bacterium]|uniref:Fibronectin type-III domain-containing protein n=1 Tax=Aerophobetes bacterium TaxID=2030807 RepID=A0A662DC17_UNCAE|nr:MAG: hypothetical protein DRJ04_06900 [Candidatus Aerophobetes bacterium]